MSGNHERYLPRLATKGRVCHAVVGADYADRVAQEPSRHGSSHLSVIRREPSDSFVQWEFLMGGAALVRH